MLQCYDELDERSTVVWKPLSFCYLPFQSSQHSRLGAFHFTPNPQNIDIHMASNYARACRPDISNGVQVWTMKRDGKPPSLKSILRWSDMDLVPFRRRLLGHSSGGLVLTGDNPSSTMPL